MEFLKYSQVSKMPTDPLPSATDYSEYREQVMQEAGSRCVYCLIDIHGLCGDSNFQIDHLKPWRKKAWKNTPMALDLKRNYHNLFWSCKYCNNKKSTHWPNENDDPSNFSCFPDPGKHDYNNFILLSNNFPFHVTGLQVAGKYMVEVLHLNRSQLIVWRKRKILLEKHEELKGRLRNIVTKNSARKSASILNEIIMKQMEIDDAKHYLDKMGYHNSIEINNK